MYFRDPVYEFRTDTLFEHVIIDFAYTFGLPTTQQFGNYLEYYISVEQQHSEKSSH
jgi:hypothetical protein